MQLCVTPDAPPSTLTTQFGPTESIEMEVENIFMSVDYKKALAYAIMAQEINHTVVALKFKAFPEIEPELFIDDGTDTQLAVLSTDPETLIVVFRGTTGFNDWKTNVQFSRKLFEVRGPKSVGASRPRSSTPAPLEHIHPVDPNLGGQDISGMAPRAKMHEGFTEAYISVQDQLHQFITFQNPSKLILVGHSLGGALATLCAIDFQLTYEQRYDIELYTYGSPRVGNPEFRELVNESIPHSYRFVNGLDAVPSLPTRWNGYRHVDQVSRIGRWFTWRIFSARIRDHFMDEYIGALRETISEE